MLAISYLSPFISGMVQAFHWATVSKSIFTCADQGAGIDAA
jgi:hypothetical protein